MIYLGATRVSEIFLGEMLDPIIHIGNYKTYPEGVVTTALTEMHVVYSSGNLINAAGSNYAYIEAELVTYIDGQEYSRGTVYITDNLSRTSGDDNFYAAGGGMIKAYSRGRVTGNTRSSVWTGTYNGSPVNSSVTVQQQYNWLAYSAGEITSASIGANVGRLNTDYAAKTLGTLSITGYRNASWTSGESDHLSDPDYWNVVISGGTDWISYNPSTGFYSVSANGTQSGRTGSLRITDKLYNTAPYYYIIYQSANEVPSEYVLDFERNKSLAASTRSFYIDVTSKKDGQPYPITASMVSFPNTNEIGATVGTIYDRGNGVYRVNFSCQANSTQSSRQAGLYINQGSDGQAGYCLITQAAAEAPAVWVLTITPTAMTVGSATTSFYVDVTSTKDGNAYPIANYIAFDGQNTMGAAVSSVATLAGTGNYRIYISCNANTALTEHSARIVVSQPETGGGQVRCEITQNRAPASIEGITALTTDGNWVFGNAIQTTGTTPVGDYFVGAILVACTEPITSPVTVSYSSMNWQTQNPGASVVTHTEGSYSWTIPAGSTVEIGGRQYYGARVCTSGYTGGITPSPGLQATAVSGFSVS